MSRSRNVALWALRIVVLFRLAFQAFFVPVYEGPDEPFHLARVRMLSARIDSKSLAGNEVDPQLARSVEAWPCGPSLHENVECPAFGTEPAAFDILGPSRSGGREQRLANYQAHQPPLYYLAALPLLKLFAVFGTTTPEKQLLLLRLFSLLLAALAILGPVRKLGRERALLECALLVALLLPGAAESLIRVANDASVFFWTSVVVERLSLRSRLPTAGIAVLSALGPLLKLTALPVVALAAAMGWRRNGWRSGFWIAVAGCTVFPLQWMRGWAWGGTLEANVGSGMHESFGAVAFGLAHSGYIFFRTAAWLGGWSFFRPPTWLIVATPAVLLVVVWRTFRLRRPFENRIAHGVGLLVATLGFVAFAIGNHRLFGIWGGVGGWYLWGWAPWLALGFSGRFELREGRGREAILAVLALVSVVQICWLQTALRLYG